MTTFICIYLFSCQGNTSMTASQSFPKTATTTTTTSTTTGSRAQAKATQQHTSPTPQTPTSPKRHPSGSVEAELADAATHDMAIVVNPTKTTNTRPMIAHTQLTQQASKTVLGTRRPVHGKAMADRPCPCIFELHVCFFRYLVVSCLDDPVFLVWVVSCAF